MIKKIQNIVFVSLLFITLANKAFGENSPGLCKQFHLGIGAGCLIGTVPPLIHNSNYSLQELCTHYGTYSMGINTGIGLALLNWYNLGQAVSRKFFNSSRGRYVAAIPALWLLSTNWKNKA